MLTLQIYNGSKYISLEDYCVKQTSQHCLAILLTKSNKYIICHGNKKHVYVSDKPMDYTLDYEHMLRSKYGTKIWVNENNELWQHEEEDDIDTLCVLPKKNVKEPFNIMEQIIQHQVCREYDKNDPWNGSFFEQIQFLKCNSVGNVGELIVKELCAKFSISYVYEGTRNRNNINGTFDILIENKRVECKTARLGKHGSFQHENIRKDGCDYHLFLDICPNVYYVTVLPKMSFEKMTEITGRKPHSRKGTTDVFKIDFSEKILNKLVSKNYTVQVKPTSNIQELNDFFISNFKNY